MGWPATAITKLRSGQHGFTLAPEEVSTLVALMDIGNIISPIPSSYILDCWGRKITLYITGATFIAASICALCATNVYWLYAARVLCGMGKGVVFSAVPIYLAEVASVDIRGALLTMFSGGINIGLLFDNIVGIQVNIWGLDTSNLILPILFMVTFFFFPESPYYLLMKGKENEAKQSLKKYRHVKKTNPGAVTALDLELSKIKANVEADMMNKARFIDVIATPGNRKALIIVMALAFLQRASGISPTSAYSTLIMPKTGGGMSPNAYMIVFCGVLVLSNYIATPIIDTWGRKPLLIISSISTAVVTGVTGVYYYLEKHHTIDVIPIQWIPYAGLILFGVSYSLGLAYQPATFLSELFPTNIKSYAGSLSTIMLGVTSYAINQVFYIVTVKWGAYVMYWFFAASCIVSTVFCVFCVIETKGKTFAEIQDILNKRHIPR